MAANTIHHLSCGTMCPYGGRLITGRDGFLHAGRLVCHCLLVESDDGLVLVDTGFGLADVHDPTGRLGRFFLGLTRPRLDEADTALRQVERLGFRREDVRHIVLTHLDLDHAGGLGEFPDAAVHVLDHEHDAAMAPRTLNERRRYRQAQWAHGPRWALHSAGGDTWKGFDSVRAVGSERSEILLVPAVGHTRGHCAVAVRDGDGWLLHCGDAYFHWREMEAQPSCPPGLRAFQRVMAVDDLARRRNQARLRELALRPRDGVDGVRLFSAHDAHELDALVAPTARPGAAEGAARV